MFPEKYEEKILKFWKENNIFKKLQKKNEGKKPWSFLDGPITANNPMGVHHAWGRTYKDLMQRYKAMQGHDERFQNGFDCQGLWVEVEVEKELGFKNKKDIEEYGIEKFVQKCKERVKKYSEIQTNQSIRLGQWMNWDNSYFTMSDENNYAIWHFLKKCKEKDLLYKGRDVVPWCPRCGTAISQHEILTEEYKEITHQSIFIKLPVKGEKDKFFVAWTTTPWTLPANVALAVHPDLEYVEIKNDEGVFILLKDQKDLIDGEVIKTFKGKELEGLEYEGMFDELPNVKESLEDYNHKVVLWDEVTTDEGTGIVHIAPGCGQEDFQLSKELKLPVVNPTNDESRYREGFDFLSGKLVSEVNDLIFENLKKKDKVLKIENYAHRYPTCWRCKTELIFRLVDEWYISMDKLRKHLMEKVKDINWIPSFGLERELDWLKNMHDWLISKKRYWGLTLPIYECECGNFEVIGSKEELKERAVEGWEEFEGHSPHKPWVDNVKIKCSKCGKVLSRIPDVGNPWLDAGIVPFSTMKYFKDREYWKKWFPVKFICESFPGQFKNWFYSLIVMSVILEDEVPAETIFGYATVVDEDGEEMHKSKGNAIWFDEAIDKIGADIARWMYIRKNPAMNLKFGYNIARETKRKVLTLWNSFKFFKIYTSKEDIESICLDGEQPVKSNNLLDQWIVSKFNNLIKEVTEKLDEYDIYRAVQRIEDFFIEDLSLWYIRRSRRRLQRPEGEEQKREIISTFYYVLLNLSKLIAPMMPFLAEEIYSGLRVKEMPESIHLFDWPEVKEGRVNNKLEERMDQVREIVNEALSERSEQGIKVRQPLNELKIPNKELEGEKELLNIIKKEVNVKNVSFGEEIELDTEITSELRQEGEVRDFIRQVQRMRKKAKLTPEDLVTIKFVGGDYAADLLLKNKKEIVEITKAKDLEKSEEVEENLIEKEVKVGKDTIKVFLKE